MSKNKYHILKNPFFAINGLVYACKRETSFKVEVVLFAIELIALFFIKFQALTTLLLIITALLILMAELLNTAIELAIDISSPEYSELAKAAKDTAAGGVMMAFIIHFCDWTYAVIS